jgi:hypothetical protein
MPVGNIEAVPRGEADRCPADVSSPGGLTGAAVVITAGTACAGRVSRYSRAPPNRAVAATTNRESDRSPAEVSSPGVVTAPAHATPPAYLSNDEVVLWPWASSNCGMGVATGAKSNPAGGITPPDVSSPGGLSTAGSDRTDALFSIGSVGNKPETVSNCEPAVPTGDALTVIDPTTPWLRATQGAVLAPGGVSSPGYITETVGVCSAGGISSVVGPKE